MNKINISFIIIATISISGFFSCVPMRKLKTAQSQIDSLKKDSMFTHGYLDACNLNVKTLMADKQGLQLDKAGLLYEKSGLQNDKAGLQNQNQNMQNDLYVLSTTSNLTIANQEKRLKNLQDLIQSQKKAMNDLKQNLANALINFKSDELTIKLKNGNIYVSLEEKLLFKSGSSVVDPKGKVALGKLAEVLNTTPKDITVKIEGHTDNVPMKTVKFEDNWDLSTGRALSIVRILTKDYGFEPSRISAEGKGEFHPVSTNDTEAGKASNRRTEIILSPNLVDLYKLLD